MVPLVLERLAEQIEENGSRIGLGTRQTILNVPFYLTSNLIGISSLELNFAHVLVWML